MDLDDLAIFRQVAREGSISRAAAVLRMTQPSVSARIRKLEGDLGNLLFQRTRQGVELTEAGRRLLPYAERCLELAAEAREAVQGVASRPRLRLVAPTSVANLLFPLLVPPLWERGVEVWTDTDHSPQALARLLDGRADAGIILGGPTIPGIESVSLGRSPILCVTAAGHPLAAKPPRSYGLADLVRYRVVLYSWGDEWEKLQSALQLAVEGVPGSPSRRIPKVTPAEVSRRLVLEHGAITFLPDLLCRADLAAGHMVRLYPHDLPPYEWHLRLIFRHRKRPDPGVQALLELMDRQPLLAQFP